MRMGRLEKLFVNRSAHGRQVALQAERMLRLVDARPGQRFLDLGCGNGAVPIHAARVLGLDATGVDVDPAQIEAAQAAAAAAGVEGVRFLTADATRLPFADDEFDLIHTNKVTHHIPAWRDALAELDRILRPGGYLLYSDLVLPGALAGVGERLAGGRAGFPTSRALDSLVAEAGLAVVHRSGSPVHYRGVFRKPAGAA